MKCREMGISLTVAGIQTYIPFHKKHSKIVSRPFSERTQPCAPYRDRIVALNLSMWH